VRLKLCPTLGLNPSFIKVPKLLFTANIKYTKVFIVRVSSR